MGLIVAFVKNSQRLIRYSCDSEQLILLSLHVRGTWSIESGTSISHKMIVSV